MKETKRKFYKKICKWKKQILCVGGRHENRVNMITELEKEW